jgi:flagellin
MAFNINTNIASLQAQEYLRTSSDFQSKTINRVTSGLRIVQSGDDAAGLAIANAFRSDQAVLSQGIRNANDGLSTLQIIDGGINNISKLLDRARTLATQSASGTYTGSRTVLNNEFQSLVSEINRQAQAIGLDTGGQFAKTLSVFIGGGRENGGTTAIENGSVSVNLSGSTVDAQSLGLSGVRAASATGTDLSSSSATTNVQSIVENTTNKASLATAGYTDFLFRGAGFSDSDRVKVSVNLSGVTNTNTLVTALNDAIDSAGNGTTAAATAFKNANIKAVVVTDTQADGSVKERVGFISSTNAFQVQAGDRLSNAVLGNFVSGSTGKSLETAFVGAVGLTTTASSGSGSANVIVRVTGSGLSGPVDLTLGITQGTTTGAQLATALKAAVDSNETLKSAGITLDTPASGESLVFRSRYGDRFDVQAAGDNDNLLGLGSFRLASDTATAFDYTSITGGAVSVVATSAQTFEFSIGGGAKQSVVVNGLLTANETGAVAAINAGIAANSVLSAAGLKATQSGGAITIASTNGTAFRLNALAPTTPAGDNFGFGTNAATGTGTAYTANFADAIYNTVDGTYDITASTNDNLFVSIDGGDAVEINLTAGVGRTITNIAADINGNATFAAKGTATIVNGQLVLTADNANTKITIVDGDDSGAATLGFAVGQSNYADKSTVNSGGAYQTAVGTNNEIFSFSDIRNGGQDQTVTLTAIDSDGTQHSLAVTLRNDDIGRNARSIDEVLNTINDQIQQSGDPTLKQIVAVKEKNATGNEEGVRLLSTLSNFRVSLGVSSGSTAAAEVGIYDGSTGTTALGQGVINAAEQSTGGSQLDISSQAGAKAAVDALAAAVATLGDSQAVVGRGQNQFSFAVNLAQSQLTNIAAAESRIRDADLAQEAANLTKAQIVLQAGIAALGQANSAPQAVLALLRG